MIKNYFKKPRDFLAKKSRWADLSYIFDWPLIAPAFFLTILGCLSIYSSSLNNGDFSDFKKQLMFFGLALVVFTAVSLLDLRVLRANSQIVFFLYLFSLTLLLGLLFFGSVSRGIRGWYRLGPFSFDPAFFSAIILIIVLAKYFSKRHVELKQFRTIIFSSLYALAPVFLIFFQPDLGSSLCLIAVWLGIIIFSGIRLRHFIALVLIFTLIFALGWQFFLKNYQKQRIVSFFNPQIDARGVSWNVIQSKIAIGSGGFLGKGLGKGSQTQLGFLPEPKTDFIFSSIAEEIGFLGVGLLLAALLFLLIQILKKALRADDNFRRLFASGLACLLLAQSFINIGMCLGLFPVVGIPLPFVSYGGSHLLAFYFALGVLISLEKKG